MYLGEPLCKTYKIGVVTRDIVRAEILLCVTGFKYFLLSCCSKHKINKSRCKSTKAESQVDRMKESVV